MTKKASSNTPKSTTLEPVNIEELEHRVKTLEKIVFALAEQIKENHDVIGRFPDGRNPNMFQQ